MASGKLKREYPNLARYLDVSGQNGLDTNFETVWGIGGLASFAVGAVVATGSFFAVMAATNPALAFVVGVVAGSGAFMGGLALTDRVARKKRQDLDDEGRLLMQAADARKGLRNLDSERKLVKWLDPVAGQMLDAGAYHWARVTAILSGPFWNRSDLGGHWRTLKTRSQRAAELAMAELTTLAGSCVGEPKRSRDSDWKAVMEDVESLDFREIMMGVARMAGTDPKEYRFQSPRSAEVFQPCYELVERLRKLADMLDREAQEAVITGAIPSGSYASESIDSILGDLNALRQAEDELRNEQRH